jgi:hypothetical protein
MTDFEFENDTEPVDVASPPCFMGEMASTYLSHLNREETLDLLNLLLECERAGARGLMDLSHKAVDADARDVLRDIADDEARFCAMLAKNIDRLGGVPSRTVGAFYDKLRAAGDVAAQLILIDRGQDWVARKLREALPRISAEALCRDLQDMLTVHERNSGRASALNGQPGRGE